MAKDPSRIQTVLLTRSVRHGRGFEYVFIHKIFSYLESTMLHANRSLMGDWNLGINISNYILFNIKLNTGMVKRGNAVLLMCGRHIIFSIKYCYL